MASRMSEGFKRVVRFAFATAVLMVIAACAGRTSTRDAQTGKATQPFDSIFDDVFARYHLPGLALGVVQNGQIIYTRTAGEVSAGTGEPITADTLFKIASNSKAMTTGVMARLVDAGKLRWDDPVTRYLPAFRMHDPWVTREMQVRDLLMHNSGLREGAGDLMLWPEPNSFTREDIIAGLAHLEPTHSFRSSYDYDNLMYVVAGEVAAAAAGTTYEELVQRELFAPLRMPRCRVGEWRRDEVGNVAQPHMRQNDGNVLIRRDDEVIAPTTSAAAGGIRCSLNDMLQWVRMWLDPDLKAPGTSDPWLSRAQRDVLWSAHMPMPLSQRQRTWDHSRFNAYGYGWRLSDVDGVLRVAHTGTLAGMYSAVTLLPEKNIGFVFLINGDGAQARIVLNAALVKQFTAPEQKLSAAHFAEELAREQQDEPNKNQLLDASSRQPVAVHTLSQRLGVYRDPWFGEVAICERSGAVSFQSAKSPMLTGTVVQVDQRMLVDWLDDSVDAESWLEFSEPGAGAPTTLRLSKVDPEADFSYDYEDLRFSRVRDCE
jgi:CubicO group peptidase (beta-lactamase class C family)